ncbi:MAG: hypothetical protein ACO2PN_11905 [Pyrobaculum sp.]
MANALLFTVGFAIHNATEGFGIAAPLLGDRRARVDLKILWVCLPGWPARHAGLRRVLPWHI